MCTARINPSCTAAAFIQLVRRYSTRTSFEDDEMRASLSYIYIYIFESESNKRFGVRCTSLLSQDRSQLYIVLLLRRILPKCWRMRNLSRTRLVIDWMRWCFFVCAVSPFIFLILYKIRYWIRKALSWKRIGINNTWCRILWNNNNKNRFFLEMASFCEGSLEGLERIQLRDSIAGRRRRIPID